MLSFLSRNLWIWKAEDQIKHFQVVFFPKLQDESMFSFLLLKEIWGLEQKCSPKTWQLSEMININDAEALNLMR